MSSRVVDASTAFAPAAVALYFTVAAAVSALPAYLYHGVYGIDFTSVPVVYCLVIVLSAAFLTVSYKSTELAAYSSLTSLRSSVKSAKGAGAGNDDITKLESQSWSFFLNNAIFLGLFFFLAFYVFRNLLDVPYDLAVSSLLAAAAAWQIAPAVSRK